MTTTRRGSTGNQGVSGPHPLRRSVHHEIRGNVKNFIDLYDHTHIESNVREFLDYFVPRKVIAGNEFILKPCPRVIRSLLRWMRNKKLIDLTNDEIKDMCENQLWEDTVRDMGF